MTEPQTYDDLTLESINVQYSADGQPLEATCMFHESGGCAWFVFDGDTAEYDGHVHSVDREKAKEAVSNLPFINEVEGL